MFLVELIHRLILDGSFILREVWL